MAIFVFYDFQEIIDDYVKYLLQSLNDIVDKLIIVSNSKLSKKSKNVFLTYTDNVYERENLGFDAGAYKDVICHYLNNECWENWDEVFFLNDTFYGPVYPWETVCNQMDRYEIDFWGMTEREGAIIAGIRLPTHLQSYFLAVRKKMLGSDEFKFFWNQMKYYSNVYDVIINFEAAFTEYFSKCGFSYTSYVSVRDKEKIIPKTCSSYFDYMFELINEIKMPLVKRKALCIYNYKQTIKTLNYIDLHTAYDVSLIRKHIGRLDRNKRLYPYGFEEIDKFCQLYSKIYIYGHGKNGHSVSDYLNCKGIKVEKFIVTSEQDINSDDVIAYNALVLDKDTGIILGLGDANCKIVLRQLKNDIPTKQLLIPRAL